MQLAAFAVSFGFGILGSVPALLFKRKSGYFERAVVDFFATCCLIALYIISVELGSRGQITFYTPPSFIAGVLLGLRAYTYLTRLFKTIITRRKSG